MKYFSYGSNMSQFRLADRIKIFEVIGMARLDMHLLRFHKVSADGSGKCDAYHTGNKEHFTLGVLYEIEQNEKKTLDRFEGLGFGYDEKTIVVTQGNTSCEAITYIATKIDSRLMPYSWYLRHVLEGARGANFPCSYIDMLMNIEAIPDPDNERAMRELTAYV